MEQPEMIQASRKRLLLSWYIDFLLFITVWELLSYFLSIKESVPPWAPYAAFLAVRTISYKFIGSIGSAFMSIDKDGLYVNEGIFKKENWLTILLGVLLILEGTKQLVRWTQVFVSQPAFGFFPDETTQIIIHLLFGSLSIVAGYWFLKLDIRGLMVGIAVGLVSVISDLLSWELWGPVVEQMVITRREVQDFPVREGEIELMQSLMPQGSVIAIVVALVAMAFTYKRFKAA